MKRLLWPAMPFLYVAAFLSLLIFAEEKNRPAGFDFSGLEKFQQVMSLLEKDAEPSPEMWEKLFASPGYAALTRSEFSPEFFKNMFRLAFMPSRSDDLAQYLSEIKEWQKAMLEHYLKVKKNWREIHAKIEKIKKSHTAKLALKRALEYLPKLDAVECPPVAFVIFANDARGYSPVVIDAVRAIESDGELEDLLAHEFHHHLRNKLLSFDLDRVEFGDESVIWVLNQLHCEGIADLISAKSLFKGKEFFKSEYYLAYIKSDSIIHQIDAIFVQISNSPSQGETLGLELKKILPQSGHPTGYYMAKTILEQKGKGELIKGVGNPFEFIELYQRAATKRGRKTALFSEKTLEFIRNLEKKYIKE